MSSLTFSGDNTCVRMYICMCGCMFLYMYVCVPTLAAFFAVVFIKFALVVVTMAIQAQFRRRAYICISIYVCMCAY